MHICILMKCIVKTKEYISSVYVCWVMARSLWPHGLWPARPLCPRNLSGKSTRLGCHSLLQGIFLTQGSNQCLCIGRQILLLTEPPGRPLAVTEILQALSFLAFCTQHHLWYLWVFVIRVALIKHFSALYVVIHCTNMSQEVYSVSCPSICRSFSSLKYFQG